MNIGCPYCRQVVALRDVKPGRFGLKCPKCEKRFALVVDDADPPRVQVLPLKEAEPNDIESVPPPVSFESAASTAPTGADAKTPSKLRGFRLGKLLSRDAVGVTLLAERPLLGEKFAVKIIKPSLLDEPTYVARLVRDAYAARQIEHDNLAAVVDLDRTREGLVVVSEYVDGEPISVRLRRDGALPPREAARIALQAARGLAHAHAQGLLHRDVTPDNIVETSEGLVKLLNLGTMTPPSPSRGRPDRSKSGGSQGSTERALPSFPVGNPAYMAPETPADAGQADVRSDVYSLGGVLHAMLLGDPSGKPERVSAPKGLASILTRMIAPNPNERYAKAADVVRALEGYLGVGEPSDEFKASLDEHLTQFRSHPLSKYRSVVIPSMLGVLTLFALLLAITGRFSAAVGFSGLAMGVALSSFVIRGCAERTELFREAVSLLRESGVKGVATVAAVVLLFAALGAVALGAGVFTLLIAVSVGLAFGIRFGVDKPIESDRAPALEGLRAVARDLRGLGLSEIAVKRFFCRNGGRFWEEPFEAVFGGKSMRFARSAWGLDGNGKRRPRPGAWLDPIRDWVARGRGRIRDDRQIALFQPIEERNLIALGSLDVTARRRSHRVSKAMTAAAADYRQAADEFARQGEEGSVLPRPITDLLRDAREKPDSFLSSSGGESDEGPSALSRLLEMLFGPSPRFILGGVLVGIWIVWLRHNYVFSTEQIRETTQKALEESNPGLIKSVAINLPTGATKPLRVAGVPDSILDWFNSHAVGLSGLILVLSSFTPGVKIALFAIPAAVFAFVGRRFGIAFFPWDVEILSIGFFVLGVLFGRSRR